MDTNPFATMQTQTPSYLQPTAMTGMGGMAGASNGVSNMVKALMAGNDQFKQAQQLKSILAAKQAGASAPIAASDMGTKTMPAPMPLAATPAPVPPTAMQGGAPLAPTMAPMTPQPPVNVDPMTQALFSNIPGEGSKFGG